MLAVSTLQFDIFGTIFVLVPWIFAVGWLSGRLLGIRVGRWRSALTATIGWFIGVVMSALVVGDAGGGLLVEIPVVIFFGVFATMPLVIAADLVSRRTKPARGRSLVRHPVRTIRAQLAPYGRLRELLGHARHENLLHLRYASPRALESADFARRLRLVLELSGGMLIKFGQIASSRTDLLPTILTDELSKLRADVPAVAGDEVRGILERELGEPVETTFESFEWEPLAAASIGQTHRAVLHDGTRVVVKVQRPGVDDLVRRDAAVLRLAAAQLQRRVAAAQVVDVGSLVDELIRGVQEELDYTHEASVGMRLRENRAADEGVGVPEVHSTLLTERILVMEEVVGRTVSDNEAVEECGVPRAELSRRLLSSFLGQVLQDGLYHADPHPGNVLVDAVGTLWLLDFGSVGRVDPVTLEGLQGLALGFALSDTSVLARAVRHLSADEGATDLRSLEGDLGSLLGDVKTGGGIDPQMMAGVLAVMDRHGLAPPPSLTLLGRALITLEGTLRIINPQFDLARESAALVATEHREDFGTPQELLQREALRALPALRTLPEHVETLANQLRAGRLSVRTERFAGQDRRLVEEWIDRVTLAAMGGFGAIAAAVLLLAGSSTGDKGVRDTLWGLGFVALAFATALLMRSAAQTLRRLPIRDKPTVPD